MLLVWPTNFYLENEISLCHMLTNAVNPSHTKAHRQYSMQQAKKSAQNMLTYAKSLVGILLLSITYNCIGSWQSPSHHTERYDQKMKFSQVNTEGSRAELQKKEEQPRAQFLSSQIQQELKETILPDPLRYEPITCLYCFKQSHLDLCHHKNTYDLSF